MVHKTDLPIFFINETYKFKGALKPVINSGKYIRTLKDAVGFQFRLCTSIIRAKPSFIIIGGQKCGTTSLFRYLQSNPYIFPSRSKEIHFFDEQNFSKGIQWYRAHFPTTIHLNVSKWLNRIPAITGEASPYYLAFPSAPKRVASIIPQVKLIIMLRNPIDRAFSHYHHQVRKGRESLSFEEAVEAESERLKGEEARMEHDVNYYSYNFWAFSYLTRGLYINQIEKWSKFFPRKQIFVLNSEIFFKNPEEELNKTLKFLNLPSHQLANYPKTNSGKYRMMASNTRSMLARYFRPYNEKLFEWLGQRYSWD